MAPPVNKRALPPDPLDAGNCVSKLKASSCKSNTDGKSIRFVVQSAEALRKAETIERALYVSQYSADKTIKTEEYIMDEKMSDTSDSVFALKPQELPQLKVKMK